MDIQTTRFGGLKVSQEDILTFPDGLLGFENLKEFFVVDPGDSTLILWLQSIQDGSIAFPVIEPKVFKPDFVAKLLPADIRSIDLESMDDARIYCILTIPQNITEMSANLKAPVVINSKTNRARQIVLQDNKLAVQFPMYLELKKYIVAYTSDDSRRTTVSEPAPGGAPAEQAASESAPAQRARVREKTT